MRLPGLLIVLAHALAIEVSTLSSIIVQHLGIPDPVDLERLWDTVRKTRRDHSRVSLRLRAFCHHEAVLEALIEHAAHVDAVLRAVHGTANSIETLRPLRALPPRVSADTVLPAEHNRGKAVFATPVSGFRLDEERIRELLMDRQLYRDPALAIRELYQNALDACRYRWARIQHRNKLDNTFAPWDGEITFIQGIDDFERHYLECRDTGVGMAKSDLQGAFSRAEVRFTDSSEFLEEREEWRHSGVKFHPNSRFGIGVMSYFMLADEIEVETCRMSRDARPGTVLTVTIAGPGHLFRIQPKDGRGTNRAPGFDSIFGRRIRLRPAWTCCADCSASPSSPRSPHMTAVRSGGSPTR